MPRVSGAKEIFVGSATKIFTSPDSNDELEFGPDETWGLLIGAAGAMPMQVY